MVTEIKTLSDLKAHLEHRLQVVKDRHAHAAERWNGEVTVKGYEQMMCEAAGNRAAFEAVLSMIESLERRQ